MYGIENLVPQDNALLLLAERSSAMKSYITLYIVAQKYLVPRACAEAKRAFDALLACMSRTPRHLETLGELVRHVYKTYADEATEFCEPLVAHFVEHVKDAAAMESLRELFREVPDFAFDVTAATMSKEKPGAEVKATRSKRKRLCS